MHYVFMWWPHTALQLWLIILLLLFFLLFLFKFRIESVSENIEIDMKASELTANVHATWTRL